MKTAIYFKPKNQNTLLVGVYVDDESVKVTEKCIFFTITGENKRINKDDLLFWLIDRNTTKQQYEKQYDVIRSLFTDEGFKCWNGDVIKFDYDFNEWVVNDDTFINGEDVKEIIFEAIGITIKTF